LKAEIMDRLGFVVGPLKGLQISRAQLRIYSFLVDCCKQLLFDGKTEDLLNSTYTIQPEPPNVQKQEDGTTTFANAARSLPYGALGSLNIDRIMYLVSAAFNAANEHL
jgi:hypothetical protein